MSHQLLFAFLVFAAVMAFTPGPNNIMVLSSGVTYGFRSTMPHIAGVTFGFAFMIAVAGFGFGAMFVAYPLLQTILKYAGAAYLIYLAALIAVSGPAKASEDSGRGPMTFSGAALFQWINVKGWVVVIGSNSAYAAIARYPWNILIQTLAIFMMCAAATVTWTLFGAALRPVLTSERLVRIFNVIMALLLLASLVPVFVEA